MPYGSSHTATLPTVSVTTGPTYATQINAAITEIRATVDAKVTPAGITINADLPFTNSGVFYACTSVERTNYQNKSGTISAGTFPVSVYVTNGNLHYNDGAGNIIQLTSGGALNIAATGGITGSGYGSAGVEVNWESGTTRYRFKSASGADAFAHVAVNDLLLNDGSGNFITHAAPAISADYTVTWPTAVPAATNVMMMSSAGTISVPTDLTLATNQHVIVSGTGLYKRPSQSRKIIPHNGVFTTGTGTYLATGYVTNGAAGDVFILPLELNVSERILSIDIRYDTTVAAGRTTTATLKRKVDGANTSLGNVTSAESSVATMSISSINETVNTGVNTSYVLEFTYSGGSGVGIFQVHVNTDVP